MKTDPEVIRILNDALTNELTAVNQYMIHARLHHQWGFRQLAERLQHEVEEERKHADQLIARILFLEGVANMERYHQLRVGANAVEALESDLQVEYAAVKYLNQSIERLRQLGDHGSEELLRHILVQEEPHVDWLETQLELVRNLGAVNYLAEKL